MLESLGSNFRNFINYLSGKSTINDKNIAEAIEIIKNSLVDADVNLRVIRRFLNSIIEESKGVKVLRGIDPKSQFIKIVNDNLVKFWEAKIMSLVYILPISNLIFLCWDFKVLARPRHAPSFL